MSEVLNSTRPNSGRRRVIDAAKNPSRLFRGLGRRSEDKLEAKLTSRLQKELSAKDLRGAKETLVKLLGTYSEEYPNSLLGFKREEAGALFVCSMEIFDDYFGEIEGSEAVAKTAGKLALDLVEKVNREALVELGYGSGLLRDRSHTEKGVVYVEGGIERANLAAEILAKIYLRITVINQKNADRVYLEVDNLKYGSRFERAASEHFKRKVGELPLEKASA